ncbi:hypothetical protein GJ700_19385 [Duganella sp. FT92W]|uniref:DUF4148 domain-containing protein n=1 Tax=Pseudoduganella rivuli TaxID=2666085 RepID=A0A7X2IPZ2_9BURK|nr:hypothetical protein [Pseudoduganella rivuli]MRV73880.1 hypothetical protein [Pseudoduganella rivuli]
MLKRFAIAAVLVISPLLPAQAAPEDPGAFDQLMSKAAEIGYPVALSLEIQFRSRADAVAAHNSFAASGIRPPAFGISEVQEFDGMESGAGRQPRSVKWYFYSKPYRIESPQQFQQELQKLRTVKLEGATHVHNRLDSGDNVPPAVPMPR